MREHFREKHFLCEEGRCSTEQFTHAFRTEIDLKAHKTACHSRSRAEARQNRQIDLQFSYTPRHPRRNEGVQGLPSAKQAPKGSSLVLPRQGSHFPALEASDLCPDSAFHVLVGTRDTC